MIGEPIRVITLRGKVNCVPFNELTGDIAYREKVSFVSFSEPTGDIPRE